MAGSKFVQVLRVEDFRIESGVEASPGTRSAVSARNVVRIWLMGTPALPHAKVTNAFLEARSDWPEPGLPSFDFHRRRILIPYTLAAIQPVVSMLHGGAPLFCQYREFHGGAVYADVHEPQRNDGGLSAADLHWVPND